MKNFYTICASLLIILIFSGCDKFKEKRYSTTVTQNFTVNVEPGAPGPVTVEINGLLDAVLTNAQLNEVKDHIKSYELVAIRYKVWEYFDDPSINLNGSLGFGNKYSSEPGVSAELNDISLQAGMDNSEHVKIDFNSSEVDKLEQYFLDTNAIKVYLEATVSDNPASFIFQVVVDIDAIAEEE